MKTARERDLERMADIRRRDAEAEARHAEKVAGNAAILGGVTDRTKATQETNMESGQRMRARAAFAGYGYGKRAKRGTK